MKSNQTSLFTTGNGDIRPIISAIKTFGEDYFKSLGLRIEKIVTLKIPTVISDDPEGLADMAVAFEEGDEFILVSGEEESQLNPEILFQGTLGKGLHISSAMWFLSKIRVKDNAIAEVKDFDWEMNSNEVEYNLKKADSKPYWFAIHAF